MITRHKPLLAIIGPTASGKSDLAVHAALRYGGEVVSVDSRQVYRFLDSTTGKISQESMCGVPHYLLSIVDPEEDFSAHSFADHAIRHVEDIYSRGKLPVLAGGTGFYLDALLFEGALSSVPADPEYRLSLGHRNLSDLQQDLQSKDPSAYSRIDIQNPRRLIRALEIIRAIGFFPLRKRTVRYPYTMIGIRHSRPSLREKIAERLDERFAAMTSEIQELLDRGVDPVWLDGLGLECRYISRMLTQNIPKEVTRDDLLQAIFAYAKRQERWWSRYPEATWYEEHQYPDLYRFLDSRYQMSS